MPARNIAGQVSDRHGIPLLHALRLDVDSLETGVPDSDDTVLAVLDGVLSLVDVNDLPSGSGGEVNTASNVGAGAEVFKQKTGVDLEFRTLLGSASIDISQAANELTFSVIGAGVTGIDHGSLSGLSDDDHTQYLLASGTRALTGNWAAGTFSIGLNTATPDRRLEILDTANPQMRLTHTDSSRYTDLQAHNDATYGGLSILPAANASSLNVVTLFGLTETTGLTFLDDPGSAALWMRTTQAKDIFYHTAATNAHKFLLGFADRFWIQDSLITFFVASKYAFFQASTNTVGVPLLINLQSTGGAGADGIGAGIQWEIEDSSAANLQAQMDVVLDDADVGTGVDSSFRFYSKMAGALDERFAIGKLGETVFNDPGVAINFRVESDGNANMLFVDGTNNRVGVGTNSPTTGFDARGGAVFNEDGAAVFFRVEGDTDVELFVVDGPADAVGIGTGTPLHKFTVHSEINVNDLEVVASLSHGLSGAPANGIGTGLSFICAGGPSSTADGIIGLVVDNVLDTVEDTSFRFRVFDAGSEKEVVRIDGSFPGVLISNDATQVPDARLHVIGTGHFTSDLELDGALNHDGTTVGFYGATPVTQQTYTASNVTTDRSYDANATTVDELADVVGTLIADLRAVGLVL